MATIIIRKGKENETPFSVARAFCKTLCDKPVVPSFPVYGGNNWYYCYGISNQTQILEDAKRVADWASGDNRPFMLVDGGWQEINIKDYAYCGGPWIKGNSGFPDMEALAQSIKDLNVKPGLWFRPLTTIENMPAEWKLPSNRFKIEYEGEILDPSVPEVLEHIEKDVRRFLDWGYELIKHDFSTWDIFGRWGFDMKEQITNDGWSFADTSKTSAQIIKGFYQAIYKQGKDALIIGCNTISHLAAGLVHIQRTGDDTSGLDWERTRKMGVNTLAFRMQQHETFYYSDCDCVGLTNKIPWELNKQWMELLSESGTPFFVSASPDMLGEDQNKAIRKAFDVASKYQHPAEPLDWMDNTCPSKWNIDGKVVKYTWDDLNRKCFDLG